MPDSPDGHFLPSPLIPPVDWILPERSKDEGTVICMCELDGILPLEVPGPGLAPRNANGVRSKCLLRVLPEG
eukprot:12437913-Alexandrium_andersonii.AAC.1